MIDNIYFLTISDSPERINNAKAQAQKLIDNGFTSIQLFKNYKFPSAITKVLRDNYFPSFLGEGIFSCVFGHTSIMRDALDKGYEKILIFEDDIALTRDGINFIKRLDIDYRNLEYDCIRLYHSREGLPDEEFSKYKYDFINHDFFRYKALPKNVYIWGNLAYIVNRKYMKAYIEYFDNHIEVADRPNSDYENFVDKYDLKIYITENNHLVLNKGFETSLIY